MADSSLRELGINIVSSHEGNIVKGLKPVSEVTPLIDTAHLDRHWIAGGLGSEFIANDHFKNSPELARFLESVITEVIEPNKRNRSLQVTLEFNSPVGRLGVTEILPEDEVSHEVRDSGTNMEVVINTVKRSEKPPTNLLTFEMKPVFPPKGSGGAVTYQLRAAFPGEASPSLKSKDPGDVEYWRTHAFIKA